MTALVYTVYIILLVNCLDYRVNINGAQHSYTLYMHCSFVYEKYFEYFSIK